MRTIPRSRPAWSMHMRRSAKAYSIRQWRSESDGRRSSADQLAQRKRRADLRKRFQNGPDSDENHSGSRPEIANARTERLVFDQYPGKSRWRGSRRSGIIQDQRGKQTSVLDQILQPELYPDLYKDFTHKVRIHYYPPRGDNKEGWDNIDIYGWLGYPMQIKINFLCRD